MISTARPHLPWRSAALALFASMFAFIDLAQGQGQNRSRQGEPQMQDNPRNQQRSRLRGNNQSLKVGQFAPTFTLASPDGKETFDLRDSRGKRPVVLIFGSYT